MHRIEEKDGKLIFHFSPSPGGKNFGLLLIVLAGLTLFWGFAGSFQVANLIEPLTLIRATIAISIASFLVNLAVTLLFQRSTTEISLVGGKIKITSQTLCPAKVVDYSPGEVQELRIKDPISEYEKKYSKDDAIQTSIHRRYFLEIKIGKGNGKDKVSKKRVLYSDNDREKIVQLAEKISKAIGVPILGKELNCKSVREKEIIFKNDGPLVGSIFEEKCEFRDLYYRFYQVISDTEETLKLVELASARIGESEPGDRFGWMFPEIEALKALPRDPEVSFDDEEEDIRFKEEHSEPVEDWDDDDEEYENEIKMSGFKEDKEILITRAGADYRDKEGRIFKRWDGVRKPYREV